AEREQMVEAERKRIEELSKVPKKKGILLPGVSNLIKSRRSSSIYDIPSNNSNKRQNNSRVTLKPSRSESDTQVMLHSSESNFLVQETKSKKNMK
ncbi:hypothetical protein CU098_000679, partial [Rhizopus stolonifer]